MERRRWGELIGRAGRSARPGAVRVEGDGASDSAARRRISFMVSSTDRPDASSHSPVRDVPVRRSAR
ncbi:hypothetical protein BJF78_27205 [Pseudonocardia sp. CNS-139]|nr:hypothetical protein BJF78_27205 [Pseudonocardia sp. CNS-139]